MDRFSDIFDEDQIHNMVKAFKSVDDRIDYLYYKLSIFSKIFEHASNEDIELYIEKYNLKKFLPDYDFAHNDKSNDLEFDFGENVKRFRFISSKYNVIQYKVFKLLLVVEEYLEKQKFAKSVINGDIDFIYDDEILDIKLNSFDNPRQALAYAKEHYSVIEKIEKGFDNISFGELYMKFKLQDLFPVQKDVVPFRRNEFMLSYSNFKYHLWNTYLPYINDRIKELELEVKILDAGMKYPDKFVDEEDKFPDFDFEFNRIDAYCSGVFKLVEEKIEYYVFLLRKYNRVKKLSKYNYWDVDDCVSTIKNELRSLKEIQSIRRNKPKDNFVHSKKVINHEIVESIKQALEPLSKNVNVNPVRIKSPRKSNYSDLTKHYFQTALSVNGVPKLEELADNRLSAPSWSKKLNETLFLVDLSLKIDKKLDSKRIKAVTKEVYIKLKLDIKEKLKDSKLKDNENTGQTNKHNKGLDERKLKHSKPDIFDDNEEYGFDNGDYNDNYNDPDNY